LTKNTKAVSKEAAFFMCDRIFLSPAFVFYEAPVASHSCAFLFLFSFYRSVDCRWNFKL